MLEGRLKPAYLMLGALPNTFKVPVNGYALETGKYNPSNGDQLTLAKTVTQILAQELQTRNRGFQWQEIDPLE